MTEHAPHNALYDPDEIARFHDRCSDLMRELLAALAITPDEPRPFGDVEDSLGWPRGRIASMLGGVCRLRQTEFGGRRPYRLNNEQSGSGRWEIWMDAAQTRAALSEGVAADCDQAAGRSSASRATPPARRWPLRSSR